MDGSKHPTMHGRVALFKNFWARLADYGGCRTLFQQTSFPNSWYFLVCLYTVARQQSFLSNTPHSPNIFLLVLSNKCRVLECAYPRVLKCRILCGHKRPTWGSGSPFFNSCQWELKIQTLMEVCRAVQDLLRIITENWEVDGEKKSQKLLRVGGISRRGESYQTLSEGTWQKLDKIWGNFYWLWLVLWVIPC